MPTYSYRCTECGSEFDVRQSFSDEPLKVCEACGGSLRKLFNSVGIVFKGSGFYHNDARSSSSTLHSKNSEGREASDSAGSGSGESASSENGNSGSHSGNANAHSRDTGSQSGSADSGQTAGLAEAPASAGASTSTSASTSTGTSTSKRRGADPASGKRGTGSPSPKKVGSPA